MSLIHISHLKKHYDTIKALDDISLTINRGEIFGLLGVNGAGKTTLSSILATLHPPTDGDIQFEGTSIYKNINEYRKHVGFCPQKPNLLDALTVRQNLVFAGKYFDMPDDAIQKKLTHVVEKYNLARYLDSKPGILSGGYRQRVLLARALMHNPKLVILDEPTVGLDPHIRQQLWKNISDLKEDGVTVILTTHYLDEAEVLSDRICILDKGRIKLIDTPKNLMTAYEKSKLEDVFIQLTKEEAKQ